jgi:hypothetical protein
MPITVTPVNPAGRGVTFAADGIETRTGGVGGWESLARPRQDAALGWVGGTEDTLSMPLILNGIAVRPGVNANVQPALDRIWSWGLPNNTTDEPAILQVTGARLVRASERWVIADDGISVSDYTVIDGQTVQVFLTLSLIRYVEPVLVAGPAAKARRRAKGKASSASTKNQPATKKKGR